MCITTIVFNITNNVLARDYELIIRTLLAQAAASHFYKECDTASSMSETN